MARFTPERRERFLTLIEAGRNVEEACADVGISRATVSKWRAKGRKAEGPCPEAEFAERLDAIAAGEGETRLTADDGVRLLEVAARKGSVQAQKILLDRLERKGSDDDEGEGEAAEAAPTFLDELARRRAAR